MVIVKEVLRKITEEGQIVTALTTTFPATEIANPEIFPSLLFYYGMLTITATRGQRMVLASLTTMCVSSIMNSCWKSIRRDGILISTVCWTYSTIWLTMVIGVNHWNSLLTPTRRTLPFAVPSKASEISKAFSQLI